MTLLGQQRGREENFVRFFFYHRVPFGFFFSISRLHNFVLAFQRFSVLYELFHILSKESRLN